MRTGKCSGTTGLLPLATSPVSCKIYFSPLFFFSFCAVQPFLLLLMFYMHLVCACCQKCVSLVSAEIFCEWLSLCLLQPWSAEQLWDVRRGGRGCPGRCLYQLQGQYSDDERGDECEHINSFSVMHTHRIHESSWIIIDIHLFIISPLPHCQTGHGGKWYPFNFSTFCLIITTDLIEF